MNIKNLQQEKTDALNAYKTAKATYLKDPNYANWLTFCDTKSICMRLGVRI